MVAKTDFTAEEWSQVLGSVMMAAMAVTFADPSGLIDLAKEGLASGSALVAAKNDPQSNALIKSVVSDFETSEGRTAARSLIMSRLAGKQAAEMKGAILERFAIRTPQAFIDAHWQDRVSIKCAAVKSAVRVHASPDRLIRPRTSVSLG